MLSRVHLSGPTSRAALTAELGLNRSTIGALSAQLESLDLVRSSVPAASERTGRPSYVLTAREDVAVLAVSLDVEWLTVALVASRGPDHRPPGPSARARGPRGRRGGGERGSAL